MRALLLALTLTALGPSLAAAAPTRARGSKAPPTQYDFSEFQSRLMEMSRRLDAARSELRPALKELAGLSGALDSGADPSGLAERHRKAHQGLPRAMDRASKDFESLNDLVKELNSVKLQIALGKFLSGREFSKNAPKEFADSQFWEAYRLEYRDFIAKAWDVEKAEEAAYAKALEEAQQRSARRRDAAAAALATLALSGGVLLWWRRRARKDEALTVEASPVTGTGVEPAGPVLTVRAPPTLPPPEGPGTVLADHYRIERELGRGGMGVVYEATDLSLGRRVALKRLHEALSYSERELGMFLAEARLVAALKHPGIVEIYDNLRLDGRIYLVFELVDGRPLSEVLRGKTRLRLEEIKEIVRQTAEALDHAHEHRVIHKDLKPANIMIERAGRVKIMDFGIAHEASLTVARQTRSAGWGTPQYMAPEQELGAVSRESDLFSLGVVLYEMLTGRLPYAGPDFLAQKRRQAVLPPCRLSPGLPSLADGIVARALRPEPSRRYHSGAELAEDVGRLA